MMKKVLFLVCTTALLFVSCQKETLEETTGATATDQEVNDENVANFRYRPNYFLVANRGSGTVSVFNAATTEFLKDFPLPDENAEPTYLAYSRYNRLVYVADFANGKIVYYNAYTFEHEGEIDLEKGLFHMWINDFTKQLWVNNIVSKTTSVIDLRSNTVRETLALPTDDIPELSQEAAQHDVVISPFGDAAYVTIFDGPKSYVAQYSTRSLKLIRYGKIGGGAHLLPVGRNLYAPCQGDNAITLHNWFNLDQQGEIPFEATHGIAKSWRHVFTTGISNNTIGVIDRYRNRLVSSTKTDIDTPHNLAVNRWGKILMVTHSGPTATKVSFYNVDRNGELVKRSDYDSGSNPFGVVAY